MSKRSLEWSETKYNKFLKEKRGQGVGKNYNPWIHIQDFPSQGRVSRVPGIKSQRVHHLFSDIETRCCYIFDWSNQIVDIREQFPLLEYEEVIKIAEKIGVSYPRDRSTDFPIVMTTDFLLTVKNKDGVFHVARTVKPYTELDKKRVIEKYEIERRYWLERNVDWGIITEKELPIEFVQNIQWVHPLYNFEIQGISNADFSLLTLLLKKQLEMDKQKSIQQVCNNFDLNNNIQDGISLSVFRHLVARKEIILDIRTKIDINQPLEKLGYIYNLQ